MVKHLMLFESRYHLRQLTFMIAGALFLGLGMLIAQGNFGSGELHKNAPYVISYITCMISLAGIFVSTLLCAQVVLRDTTYDMNALLFSTTLRRLPYFIVRLTGLFVVVLLVLALGSAGIWLGTMSADTASLGPFRLRYFIQPLLVFSVPNVLLCCSILFSVALLTRQVRAVYMAGVGLFILYFLGSILGNSPLMANSSLKTQENQLWPQLLDPFAITSFFGLTRHWTVDERNQQLLPLAGALLLNRLTWLALAGGLLWLTYRRFAFRLPVATSRRTRPTTPDSPIPLPYHRVSVQTTGRGYSWRAFASQWRLETNSIFRHIPFLVLLALWAFLTAVDLKETILHGPYNIRFYTASGYIVEYLRPMRPALLLVVFYAGELIHRERATRMHELIFATRVPDTVLWCAKTAALASLIASLVTVNILTGIGFQLAQGFHPIEWNLYCSLFLYSGWPLLLYAILIGFLQSLFNNKYAGMLLSLAVVGVFLFGNRLGLHSYLVRYAATPLPDYAYMSGWGHEEKALYYYLLYWTAIAGLLLLAGAACWKTRNKGSFRSTFRQQQRPRFTWKFIMTALCLSTCLAIAIFVRYSAGHQPLVREALYSWQASYEKTYRSRVSLPQPSITHVQLATDLYPGQRRYTVRGQYRLRNESSQPVTTVWLGNDAAVTSIRYTIPNARLAEQDDRFGQSIYQLGQPLQPGDSMTLSFTQEVIQSPFVPFNSEHAIVDNGSYVELEKYLPYLGYQEQYELEDAPLRKKQGLPPQTKLPATDSAYHFVTMDHVISTVPDQQVVSVGALQRDWTQNGRHYFHYQSERPIAFKFAFSSARYALHRENHDGVQLNILYQPGLDYNIPLIAQAMTDALDYGSKQWGAYPFQQLTLAAIPHYPGAATAYPGVLFSTERISFMSNLHDSTRFNSVYAVTAHEVAHQWWANVLSPMDGPGRAVLTESLAKFGEYMAVEKRFGAHYLRRLLQADNNLYFALRGMDHEQEQPLYQTDKPYVYYQKGGMVMYGIKEMLGEDTVNAALRALIAQHGYPASKGRPDDLLQLLVAGTNQQQAAQIQEWFTGTATYDNAVRAVRCDSLTGGRFRLTIEVQHGKKGTGKSAPSADTPPDLVPIALYAAPHITWDGSTQPLYRQHYWLSRSQHTLVIEVDRRPAVVAIDPLGYLPDEDLSNNYYLLSDTE
ncbi:M1 family aminopeptidase [Paraflavitalea pollutisoli]|uniref:M1 family aminopeptidase n=1 Tax=Paraflavitalea pollutisoli TaxID=3034143 RepID=UPI0023EAD024|nr:M1 family aminopeptidase [Paraflavitalea sp. H1-2-19X]